MSEIQKEEVLKYDNKNTGKSKNYSDFTCVMEVEAWWLSKDY